MPTVQFLLPLLVHLLGDLAEAVVRVRMQESHLKILAGMVAKDMTPDKAPVGICVRDAIFRLWKAVVWSGDLADVIRDAVEPSIVPLVEGKLPKAPDLDTLVRVTREEVLVLAFGGPA